MSSYKPSPIRKRRSDDESSDGDDGSIPPVKKQRSCNGESSMLPFSLLYIKSVFTSKYNSALSWIADLPVKKYFKRALMRQSSVDDDDSEGEEVVALDDDDDEIAVLAESTGIGSQHNSQEQSSFGRGSLNRLPKPLSASTPRYRDGSLVGVPNVPSKKKMNGLSIMDKKSNDRSQIQQLPKRVNHQSNPISNPPLDIDIMLDSNESVYSAEELEILSQSALRKLPYNHSAFSRTAMSTIPVSSNDLGVARGVNRVSSFPFPQSGGNLSTANEVIRLKEKEVYQRLLDKMALGSTYHPVKTNETEAIQVDLTQDEHEEFLMGCSYDKEMFRKPVADYMEKYYKSSQFVKRTIVSPPMVEEIETQENIPPSTLPEHKPIEKRCNFFSYEWLQELKISLDEETSMRMEAVKNDERIIQRHRERREARLQEEKCLFEKYKVPGDVFAEPGGGRDDYPELTPEMDNMINAALQKFVGNENDELSSFNGVTVTRKHMLTLLDSTWLIDEVLNFYFNLIVERSKLDNYPSVYAFNTFFFTAINNRGVNSVLRWTRKVDIFSYDIIFVPLHLGVHWALCVIDNRSKTIKYYDSMGTGHEQSLYLLQSYLITEMKAKKNIVMDNDEYSLEVTKDLPQQMNGSDCGMFTLKYAEYISRDAPISFKQAQMKYFRRRMVYEILSKQLM